MLNSELNDELISLKEKLEANEVSLGQRIKSIEFREQKWKKLQKDSEKIILNQKNNSQLIKINIGGEIFQTLKENLLEFKTSLFALDILRLQSNKNTTIDNEIDELFYDRSATMFPTILNYLRTKTINYKQFTPKELSLLRIEAEYYDIDEINFRLNNKYRDIKFLKFESSKLYYSKDKPFASNNLQDLTNLNETKGFALEKCGYITITLSGDFDLISLELKGLNKKNEWHENNGSGSFVYISLNGEDFEEVGRISLNFGSKIQKIKFPEAKATRYIKIEDKVGYLGLSYLKLEKVKDDLKFDEDKN